MSAQRGVLAVMDEAASWLPYDGEDDAIRSRFVEARAAVCDLIAADKEYDAANLALQTLDAADFADDWECDAAYDALCARFDAALTRRAAALARMDPQPGEEQ